MRTATRSGCGVARCGLHGAQARADPRRTRRGDAGPRLRDGGHRGAAARLLLRHRDLRSGQFVVSRFGPPADSVGLSMRMPVLAPAQVRGRRLLVDASLIDNLPLSTLAALGEGPLITVDVKASFDREGRTKHRRGEIRAPSLAETLIRVLRLASSNTSAAARRYADLTIEPRSEGVGLLEFHQLDRAREAGRREARQALDRARAPRSRILARGLPGLLG